LAAVRNKFWALVLRLVLVPVMALVSVKVMALAPVMAMVQVSVLAPAMVLVPLHRMTSPQG
jgi:cation transport ATPase